MRRRLTQAMLVVLAGCVASLTPAAGQPGSGGKGALQQIAEAARRTTRVARRPDARAKALVQVAEALAGAGADARATEVMREALAAATHADSQRHLLLNIADGCVRAGLLDLAAEIADRTDYPPHAIHILCALARARAAAGDARAASAALADAETLAEAMDEAEGTARAWLRAADAAQAAGLADRAAEARARAVHEAGNARSRLVAATLVEQTVSLSLEAGRPEEALSQANLIESPDVAVPVLICLVAAFQEQDPEGTAELMERAAAQARTADSPYRRALLLARTAAASDEIGDADGAGRLFAEARRAVGETKDNLRAATARSAVVDALISSGRHDAAEALALTDDDTFRRSELLVRAALALAEAGENAEAVRLTEAADADYLKYGAAPSLQALGLAHYKAWGEAATDRQFDALEPPELRDAVLAVYSEQLAGGGRLREALSLARKIDFAVTRADAIIGVALHGVAEAESQAELIFPAACMDHLEVVSDRLRLLAALALRQAELGLAADAEATLATLLESREEARTPTSRAAASGAAAVAFRMLERSEEARRTAREAMEAAMKVGCAGCRDEVIEDLLDELSRSGDLALALEALGVVGVPTLRVHNALRLLRLHPEASPHRREELARMALRAAVSVPALAKRVEFLLETGAVFAAEGISLTPGERTALRESYEDLGEDAPWVADDAERDGGGPPPIELVFFDRSGCARCDEVEAQFEQLQEMYPQLEITTYNMTGSETSQVLNVSICQALDIPEEQHMVAPALFSFRRGLIGADLTLSSMAELAEEAQGMPSPARTYAPADAQVVRSEMRERYEGLGLLVVVAAGLLDGINPCAFSVIIFFLSYLAYMGKDRREIAAVGVVFTLAVFLTYFGIGLFLSGLVTAADAWSGEVTRIIYGATAVLAFVVAALSFRDALRARRGEVQQMSLSLPESLRSRIRLTISRRARMGLTIGATLVLGAVVAFFEAPCTGQVYLPTILFAAESLPQYAWGPVGWLLLYNLCFIAPLIAVFVAVMFGLTSERLTALFRRHLATTKFAMAVFFFVLGTLMVMYLVRG